MRKGGLTVGLVCGAAILPSFWTCVAGVAWETRWDRAEKL